MVKHFQGLMGVEGEQPQAVISRHKLMYGLGFILLWMGTQVLKYAKLHFFF